MPDLWRVRASRRAWKSRKRMLEARTAEARGGAPAPKAKSVKVGYDAIMAATHPGVSSAVIARQFGLSPAYVRKVWQLKGVPRRPAGKHPEQCAWKADPASNG